LFREKGVRILNKMNQKGKDKNNSGGDAVEVKVHHAEPDPAAGVQEKPGSRGEKRASLPPWRNSRRNWRKKPRSPPKILINGSVCERSLKI